MFLLLVLLLNTLSTIAQDYERVDASIELYPTNFKTPEELSRFITRDFFTEEDKVRAIYTWIIRNVIYDPNEYKQFNYKFKNYRERNAKEEKTRKKIIERTLSQGIAVCEGYAMLFERLCELQGIQNYLVRGDIKTNFNDIGRAYKQTHMWNVAVIDGQSYLFDPTWGAGKYNGKFIKEPSYFYYKTLSDLFIKTHYPHTFDDALSSEILSREDFAAMPLIIAESLSLKEVNAPKNGTLSSLNEDGVIEFKIKMSGVKTISYSFLDKKRKVDFSEENEILTFNIPLELGKKHLLIYFNDQPALGYNID